MQNARGYSTRWSVGDDTERRKPSFILGNFSSDNEKEEKANNKTRLAVEFGGKDDRHSAQKLTTSGIEA